MGDEENSQTTQPVEPVASTPTATSAFKKSCAAVIKVTQISVVLAAEIALVAFVGGYVGSYIAKQTIAADCARVNLAKVGDTYLKCTIVELPKDPADKPPR